MADKRIQAPEDMGVGLEICGGKMIMEKKKRFYIILLVIATGILIADIIVFAVSKPVGRPSFGTPPEGFEGGTPPEGFEGGTPPGNSAGEASGTQGDTVNAEGSSSGVQESGSMVDGQEPENTVDGNESGNTVDGQTPGSTNDGQEPGNTVSVQESGGTVDGQDPGTVSRNRESGNTGEDGTRQDNGAGPEGFRGKGALPSSFAGRGIGRFRLLCIPIGAVCILIDLIAAIGLARIAKQKKYNETLQEEEYLDPAQIRQKKKRRRNTTFMMLAVLLAGALVMQALGRSGSYGQRAVIAQETKEEVAKKGEISKYLKGSGVLSSPSEVSVSIPGNLTVASYQVADGDAIQAGDVVAAIGEDSVNAAIGQAQALLQELDEALEGLKENEVSQTIQAKTAGTVAAVFAEPGQEVVDTMYQDGALLLISLDNLLAVDVGNPGGITVGSPVKVQPGDQESQALTGYVASIDRESITITVGLEDFTLGEEVSITDEAGASLGSGALYLYSQQKITGYSGTVASVEVAPGDTVSEGTELFTLSDTGQTAGTQALLREREALEKQYNQLVEIGKTGYVYAKEDGVVSGVQDNLQASNVQVSEAIEGQETEAEGKTLAVEAKAYQAQGSKEQSAKAQNVNTEGQENILQASTTAQKVQKGVVQISTANQNVQNGLAQISTANQNVQNSLAQVSVASSELQGNGSAETEDTVSKTVTLIWMDANGAILSKGLPEKVTVQLEANGTIVNSVALSAGSDWSYTWGCLPKYEGNSEIVYHISEKIPEGFAAAWKVSGDSTMIVNTKEGAAEPSGGNTDSSGEEEQPGETGKPDGSEPEGEEGEPGETGKPGGSEPEGEEGKPGETGMPGGSESDGEEGKLDETERPGAADTTPGETGTPEMPGDSGVAEGQTPNGGAKPSSQFDAGKTSDSGNSWSEDSVSSTAEGEEETEVSYALEEAVLYSYQPKETVDVEISIDELDICQIQTGQSCEVTLDSISGQGFAGTVAKIHPSGENSGGNTKYTVTVSMEKTDGMLIGMDAMVQFPIETAKDALLIPEEALVELEDKTYLYTGYDEDTGELLELTEVTTGLSDGEKVQILEGLEEGQTYYYQYTGSLL